jgi:hypothetical protein
MPASIAHMLISQKVREKLQDFTDDEFNALLQTHKNYMDLGALGPDLPYYESMVRAGYNLLLDRSDKPMGVDQWSYQLHSKDPNVFPLKMIEITWREADPDVEEWDPDDQRKFAFICGFLSHMAADQIIHPLVNRIAGPYYKAGDHREIHRECEVYQDVIMFGRLNGGADLMDDSPHERCDLTPGYGDNTPVWFRYFLQKAFVEAHSVAPSEANIEDWVDGLLFTLRGLNNFGPYTKAARDLAHNGPQSPKYQQYFEKPGYEKLFNDAVELSVFYVRAAFILYNLTELSSRERDFFRRVVQNADLSAPLQKRILEVARENFEAGFVIP